MTQVGRSVRRLEDIPLLTGRSHFVGDMSFPDQLHMRVVRSVIASGLITAIDIGEALAMPGVIAVWTSDDVAKIPPIDFRMTKVAGLEPYRQPVLARTHVRYVGEPVAVVVAENAYLAEDAVDRIFIDFDDLEVALDATLPGRFHPDLPAEAAVIEKAYGDIEAAFNVADLVVELELAVGRHSGVPMETRGAIGVWDGEAEILRMYGAAKVPHYNRDAIARMLGLATDRVHLHEGHVGGGFGIRGELYPEDVLVCLAARRLGRPVKWIEDRREHLVAANHSRDQLHRIRVAVRSDGFVLGIDDEFWHDQGAYVRTHAATVPELTAAMLPGPYRVPAYRVKGHIVLTNKTPAGTYRAPGRYEATFVRERAMDAVADRLGLDAVEVRSRNLIGTDEMPFKRGIHALGTEVTYDSGRYQELLDVVLDHVDYPALKAELATRRASGEQVGMGLGYFVEKSGLGPFDEVRIEIRPDGSVEVVTGAASVGQGVETVTAQVCADALGAEFESITVIHGQTDRIGRGMGTFATRTTVMTGSATLLAATDLRRRILDIASDLLEADSTDLDVVDGRIFVTGSPDGPSVTFADVAVAFAEGRGDAAASAENLSVTKEFTSDHMVYPYGVHLAVVEIDRETSSCRVLRYVVGYDVGRAVNPMLVDGQLVGGVAQGLGGALFEEFRYDEFGQPQAASLMDYLIPTVSEMCPVEVLITEMAPSPFNPLGVKGAGEGGINGVGAAVAAAVDDALGRSGVVTRLPISPDRLHATLAASSMGDHRNRT